MIDPTKLTTDAVNAAKDDFRRELAASADLIASRLDASDEATRLRLRQFEGLTPVIDREVQHLRELADVKLSALKELSFAKLEALLGLLNERAIAQKEALAAALQAAKELVGQQGEASAAAAAKSEAAFTKLIDQITVLIDTTARAQTAALSEVKERLDRGDGVSHGMNDEQINRRLSTGTVLAVIGGVVGVLSLVTTLGLGVAVLILAHIK